MLCSSISMNWRTFSFSCGKYVGRESFSIRTHVMNSYVRLSIRGEKELDEEAAGESVFLVGRLGGRIVGWWGSSGWAGGDGGICPDIRFDVLDDQRDSPVRGIQRILRNSKPLVSVASDLGNLVISHTALLHETAGGIGAVGGEFPISIGCTARVGFGISVALHRDFIWQFAQFLCEKGE